MHEVIVDVAGKGHALVAVDHLFNRSVVLHPQLSSISPATGSTNGGTVVTVTVSSTVTMC